MASTYSRSPVSIWLPIYLRSSFFTLIGLDLFFTKGQFSASSIGLLGALMLLLGYTAIRFWQRSWAVGYISNWFLIAGVLDALFGIILLCFIQSPSQIIVLTLAAWSILMAYIQAIETMYLFLGIQSPREMDDFSVTILHFAIALVCGSMAFVLLQQPLGDQSTQFSSVFPVVLSVLLICLSQRLQ